MNFSFNISFGTKGREVANKADGSWFTNRFSGKSSKKADYEKSENGLWAETFNPLRNLTITRAQAIYDNARLGNYSELQWLYQEIEAVHSTIFTCVERRSSALMETDYEIKAVDAKRARGFDENLAEEQKDFLTLAFADAENGNLNEAIEHLALGFFRGFSHAKPLYADGFTTLEGFDILDGWNFCRDIHTGEWYWNPAAALTISGDLQKIPQGELVSLTRPRHVDYPALNIYIRHALGEKKYGQFIERYGVPPVIITMPPDIDKNKEDAYLSAAESVALGGSGAVPNGSTVAYATEARGTNPFESFFKYQQEQIVLMATGGILTSLSSPTGVGQGASDAHSETWRTVIRRDCKLLTTPINRVVVDTLLEAAFPGRPKLAYFDFADPKPTASEVFENAAKAKTAGYLVRREDLEEKTGYELELDPNAGAFPGVNQQFSASAGGVLPNKGDETASELIASHCKTHGEEVVNKEAQETDPALERILAPISGASADPIDAALKVIEEGGTEEEAMAAYDKAAAAVLSADKIAEGAEEIAKVLEAAARAGKGSGE